jgi:PAS domain S-box-containing protein
MGETVGRSASERAGDSVEILHVEDDPAFADLAQRFLERCSESLSVTTESDPRRGLELLAEGSFDCVLSDYDMPELTGVELLERVRKRYPDLPFVLFTGKGSETVASEAFSAGATDYFRKPSDTSDYEVLAERIATVVEKYRTERRLEQSETRYRRLVETAPVAIVVHQDREIVFANQAAADFVGFDDPEEFVGTDPIQYIAEGDRAAVVERVQRLHAGEETAESIEERYITVDGAVKHALVAGSAIEYDGEPAIQAVIRDVTERRAYEHELERYRQLVEAMGDGVYALDAAGRFEMVNERMTDLTGDSREELLGRDAGEMMTDEGRATVQAAIRSLLQGAAASTTVEAMARGPDGEPVPRELTLTLQPTGSDESFAGTVGVVHDITDRLERERELERKNERLEAFADIVSHDLRNPLSVVAGHAELALERADEGADAEMLVPHLETVAGATDRMTTLTDDLLTLAKQGETVGERRPVDVGEVAREVWETLRTDGATLAVEAPGEVEADPTRLEQLVSNLLENAVEHGTTDPADPESATTATDGGSDELTVTVLGTADGFAVADDGQGIPPDERDQMFERGVSTADGTGFGLAIVAQVAEAHGWTVSAGESAAGGARFDIDTTG